MMSIREAAAIADEADLSDGAWMAMIEELSGKDAGDIASWLYLNAEHAGDCQCDKCATPP